MRVSRLKSCIRPDSRPYLLIWSVCVTLLIFIIGLGSMTLWRDHEDRKRAVSVRTQLVGATIAGYTATALEQRRFAMDALANHLLGLDWPLTDAQVDSELARFVDSDPRRGPLFVSAGERHWSLPGEAFQGVDWHPSPDVGREPWFEAGLQRGDKLWLPVFRRYECPNGRWLTVGALVPLTNQRDYFSRLGYTFDISLVLLDLQGNVYREQGRLPPQARVPGEAGVQWLQEDEGEDILLVRNTVLDYPLQVVVARWPQEYLADWNKQKRFTLVVLFLTCFVILAASVGLVSAWRRIGRGEHRYRRLFQSIHDGVLLLGASGVQEANERAAKLFGVDSAERLCNYEFVDLCYPEQLNGSQPSGIAQSLLGAAGGAELCATLKFRRLDRDGAFICEVHLSPIRLGKKVYVLACLHDISARQQTEKALEVSQQKLLEAQLIAGLGVWSWEVGAEHATWTDECARIFGLPTISGECTYGDFFGSIVVEEQRWAKQAFDRALEGERLDIELQIRRPDGQLRNILLCGELRPQGEKPLLLGALLDITEQKRVQQRLREGERHYRELVELLPEGLLIFRDYRVIFANVAAARLFAVKSVEQFIGVNIFTMIDPCFHQLVMDDLAVILKPDHVPTFCSRHYLRLDGSAIEVEMAARRLLLDGQICIQVMLRDVSEHRRLQRDLETANGRLQRLSGQIIEVQESERRHLSRELHDDIGQLLTCIKISASGIQRHLEGEIEQRQAVLVRIADEALGKVRDLSRMLRPVQLDSLGLVAAMRWQIDNYLPDSVDCLLDCVELQPRTEPCVEITLFRIFQEALNNVLKHAAADSVQIRLARFNENIHLRIMDNGLGFDYDAALTDGSGMGLMSMAERTKLVDGEFFLTSITGQGTQILVIIPDNSNNNNSERGNAA
ncbi:PAS domain S-box protein [Pseudomonas sp. TH41]|uniref:PAS domain-containing sensor histidine kinase n=1 Tax=Pseudomonas sp. TH41 TaxID=2796405 RepID=UPI001911DD43|nr:PAS domain S-box protein [Pseudomonas sp. TH41]MBK5351345.1 PAS domain S-box protein [Pseudomonas sp. TH41]